MIVQNSVKAWYLAARPKTLTAAWIPVLVAGALAYADQAFQFVPTLLCFIFAALMQIAANFINDLFDYLKGSDREDRLGPERACAQGWITPGAMRIGIVVAVGLACVAGSLLLFWGGVWLVAIGVLCVVFAFLYTTLLSYVGLGDLLVFLFFGWVPVMGTYYVQTGELYTAGVGWCSLACGLVVDTLLVVNNYRDRDADKKSGKNTLIVKFGEPFGRYLYLWLGIMACLCCSVLYIEQYTLAALFPWLYMLPHWTTWRKLSMIRSGKALNGILGETSRNMLFFCLLLTVGLLFS